MACMAQGLAHATTSLGQSLSVVAKDSNLGFTLRLALSDLGSFLIAICIITLEHSPLTTACASIRSYGGHPVYSCRYSLCRSRAE